MTANRNERVSGDEMVHTPAHLTGLIFSALRNCSEIRLSNSPMSVDFSLENVVCEVQVYLIFSQSAISYFLLYGFFLTAAKW